MPRARRNNPHRHRRNPTAHASCRPVDFQSPRTKPAGNKQWCGGRHSGCIGRCHPLRAPLRGQVNETTKRDVAVQGLAASSQEAQFCDCTVFVRMVLPA